MELEPLGALGVMSGTVRCSDDIRKLSLSVRILGSLLMQLVGYSKI